MRIEPVSNNIPDSAQSENARKSSRQSSGATPVDQPLEKKTASSPAKEIIQTETKSELPPLPQFPEDEVKVQFDKPMNDDILIYQFLDKQSGSLVMQFPTTQVLGVAHEIQEELQQKNISEPNETPREVVPGDETYGN